MVASFAVRLLHGAGLRVTRQRRTVLDSLIGRPIPVTAQQLHTELEDDGAHLGLATVYRMLNVLADAGLLHVFGEQGEAAYRLCEPEFHHHLVCRICGSVAEAEPGQGLADWLAAVGERSSFTVEHHRVEVHGVCAVCRGGA